MCLKLIYLCIIWDVDLHGLIENRTNRRQRIFAKQIRHRIQEANEPVNYVYQEQLSIRYFVDLFIKVRVLLNIYLFFVSKK